MQERLDYVKQYAAVVLDSVRGTKLFPSVVMAQAILESSNADGEPGQSLLARKFNNHFGIKADASWKGNRVDMKTGEVYGGIKVNVNAPFRAYEKAEDCFEDRTRFLTENPRYTRAGVFSARTPEEQAEALHSAGYATDPKYAAKIKFLIRTLDLKKLDEIAGMTKQAEMEKK